MGQRSRFYQLPADLSVGEYTYRVTFTADGYSKSADITITITATNKIVPTGEPTLSTETLTYGQALSAIKLSGKLHDTVNNKRTSRARLHGWTARSSPTLVRMKRRGNSLPPTAIPTPRPPAR